MILGDSLQVMASLAEREGLRGKVQCIYVDPPYGIKFNSNFQWSTTSRDVKDGKADHITREPEQVKAFRDTWRDGIHSYLTYLRDRLTVARDLLTESGSIFVQIGDENVHRVRDLMDEVFGEGNFVSLIPFAKTSGATSSQLAATCDYLLWYAKVKAESVAKYRQLFVEADPIPNPGERYVCVESADGEIIDLSLKQKQNPVLRPEGRILSLRPTDSQGATDDSKRSVEWHGKKFYPPNGRHWSVTSREMKIVVRGGRAFGVGNTLRWKFYREPNFNKINNDWMDLKKSGFGADQIYVVETLDNVIRRCILMTTDPGDLVLDPTCGSGTTAYVAEQWGRRWITIDTSRVALALARARVMGARYPYYLLAGQPRRAAEGSRTRRQGPVRSAHPRQRPPRLRLRAGPAHHPRVHRQQRRDRRDLGEAPARAGAPAPEAQRGDEHELGGVGDPPPRRRPVEPGGTGALFQAPCGAGKRRDRRPCAQRNGSRGSGGPPGSTDTSRAQRHPPSTFRIDDEPTTPDTPRVQGLLRDLNANLGRGYTLDTLPPRPADPWPEAPAALHARWWAQRIARQKEIDDSIAAAADYEYLYDRPYQDNNVVRVAGPFTVDSLSPHRTLAVDENDELIDRAAEPRTAYGEAADFASMILEQLKTAGVQQGAQGRPDHLQRPDPVARPPDLRRRPIRAGRPE